MADLADVVTTFHGWACDKRDCVNEFRLDPPVIDPKYMDISVLEAAAEDAGWTFWYSRSSYAFCPNHGPSKSAKKMRQRRAKR